MTQIYHTFQTRLNGFHSRNFCKLKSFEQMFGIYLSHSSFNQNISSWLGYHDQFGTGDHRWRNIPALSQQTNSDEDWYWNPEEPDGVACKDCCPMKQCHHQVTTCGAMLSDDNRDEWSEMDCESSFASFCQLKGTEMLSLTSFKIIEIFSSYVSRFLDLQRYS